MIYIFLVYVPPNIYIYIYIYTHTYNYYCFWGFKYMLLVTIFAPRVLVIKSYIIISMERKFIVLYKKKYFRSIATVIFVLLVEMCR